MRNDPIAPHVNENGKAFNGNWFAVIVAAGTVLLFTLIGLGESLGF